MVYLAASRKVALLVLAVTGIAVVLGDSITASNEVDFNLSPGYFQRDKVAAAWWAAWHPNLLPLDKVSWKKYTHMTYSFA